MSKPSLSTEVVKANPDLYGYSVKKEKEERLTIKGIEIKIKKYTTTLRTSGIRVSLIDNTGLFFLKFNEYLAAFDSQRPPDEKAIGIYSFTTLVSLDASLETFEDAGFYVYQNHIIFNEEEKSAVPMERLIHFIEHYKKKFGIKTQLNEDEFSSLDSLERE